MENVKIKEIGLRYEDMFELENVERRGIEEAAYYEILKEMVSRVFSSPVC